MGRYVGKKMSLRVIQVVPAIHYEASGPSYSVRRLSETLINENHFVTLATLDWSPLTAPPAFLKTFKMGLGPRVLGRSPLMKKWLVDQVIEENVDIIHNHGMWYMNAVYPGWAVKKGQAKLVISPRGAFSKWAMQKSSTRKKIFWALFQKRAFAKASCFHATGQAEYEDIRRMGFKQPVAIIPNGIDIPKLSKGRAKGQRTLLFLGRIHPVKGIEVLLQAWKEIQNAYPDWCLEIVGGDAGYVSSSGYLDKLKTLAENLTLKNVVFIGPLYGEDKLSAYQHAELYILPSHSENFGMTIAESLAAGTPVIASKGTPWQKLVSYNAGWWIENDTISVAETLKHALNLPSTELKQMGLRGRHWMETDCSWATIGKNMTDVYKWVLDDSLDIPECIVLD